jgi:hypothetical protein
MTVATTRAGALLAALAAFLLLVVALVAVPPLLWFNWIGFNGYFFPRPEDREPLALSDLTFLLLYDVLVVLTLVVAGRAFARALRLARGRTAGPQPRLVRLGLWVLIGAFILVAIGTVADQALGPGLRALPYVGLVPLVLALAAKAGLHVAEV